VIEGGNRKGRIEISEAQIGHEGLARPDREERRKGEHRRRRERRENPITRDTTRFGGVSKARLKGTFVFADEKIIRTKGGIENRLTVPFKKTGQSEG